MYDTQALHSKLIMVSIEFSCIFADFFASFELASKLSTTLFLNVLSDVSGSSGVFVSR